jgi:hypothetical protein
MRSGLFDRAVLNPSAKTLKAPMIVDFPQLFGPTRMFRCDNLKEKVLRALYSLNSTLVIVSGMKLLLASFVFVSVNRSGIESPGMPTRRLQVQSQKRNPSRQRAPELSPLRARSCVTGSATVYSRHGLQVLVVSPFTTNRQRAQQIRIAPQKSTTLQKSARRFFLA